MDPLKAPIIDAGEGDDTPDAILDALQDVISDVDAFMSDWCQRLDVTAGSCEVPHTDAAQPADESLRTRIMEFEKEKSRWESERDLESKQIQEKASQLTEAWLRLESEQRRFLQMKDANPLPSRERTTVESEPSLGDLQAPTDEQSPKRSIPSNVSPTREAAIRQFQRLRREIESSRPNSGQL